MEHFPAYPHRISEVQRIHEGYGPQGTSATHPVLADTDTPVSEADEIRQLRHEVDYLKQELEFLKKISSIRTTGK